MVNKMYILRIFITVLLLSLNFNSQIVSFLIRFLTIGVVICLFVLCCFGLVSFLVCLLYFFVFLFLLLFVLVFFVFVFLSL